MSKPRGKTPGEQIGSVALTLREPLEHAEQLHRRTSKLVMRDEPTANSVAGHSLLAHLEVGSDIGRDLLRHKAEADALAVGVLAGLPTAEE
ncbi:hypothetical protein [Saccharopolyspora phatthalungensis]|uniref:Uncharacterized protein n=1 Tax=Saccharopolyspora phatthalungensis TaxID=664693 RepID=A0A840QK74_9PSEU|nr:hypothetical protein [Saccharopolyspora phatthalungensis]MBB5159988.1 hypothetical protein [Saccharopolyspora phatthalungensis]